MKKRKKALIVFIFLILITTLLFRYGAKIGLWSGKNVDKYLDIAYGSSYFGEIPDNASDFRFKCGNFGLGAYSMAAFTLESNSYIDFLNKIDEKYSDPRDEYNFIGKRVIDCQDTYGDYGEYRGFPHKSFDYVIDDNIDDYIIYYYDSYYGAGSSLRIVVARPDTGRIIVWSSGSD